KILLTSDKKADKQKNLTQALFDYMVKKAEAPVASISGTSETSKTSNLPEPKIVERSQKDQLETSKLPEPIELISRVVPDMPPKETVSFKSINEHEERLRKWATNHGGDPDVFITITEKDVRLSWEYRDRIMTDADAIEFAKEDGIDVNEIFYMSRRERLISEEIYLHNLEDARKPRAYVYNNKEWQK
ncbi:21503_t:CDS:2, partial [Gigaspora rosea]